MTPGTPWTLRAFDGAVVLSCLLSAVTVLADLDGIVRVVSGLILVVFAPGWGLLRIGGAPFGALTLASAFGLSVALASIVSTVLVTRFDWQWRPTAIIWSAASAGLVVAAVRRDRRDQPTATQSDDTPALGNWKLIDDLLLKATDDDLDDDDLDDDADQTAAHETREPS